jgi:hypothetical protein
MKRALPESPLATDVVHRDLKRIKLDLEDVEAREKAAKQELDEIQTKRTMLIHEEKEHPETKAYEAYLKREALRSIMPPTLYQILVEEGDEKYGKLLSFETTWKRVSLLGGFDIRMVFSGTGEYVFTSDPCELNLWSRGHAASISGIVYRYENRPIADLWKQTVADNDQKVPRALAAFAMIGFEEKKSRFLDNLLLGIPDTPRDAEDSEE